MKALFFKLFTAVTVLVIFLHPAAAYAQSPLPTKTAPKQPASIYDQTPTSSATASGNLQLIPVGNGQYRIAPIDPRNQNYAIQQAGVCDVPLVGGVCDAVGSVVDTISDWGNDVWNGVKCATSPACWIKKASFLIFGAIYEKQEGCPPDDADCHRKQLASALDFESPIQNAGGLTILAGITGQMMTLQLPVSTDLYVASLNPFREAQASGFSDLTGNRNNIVLTIWQNTRNAAYALSIVILVVVGFMIMLRSKLDPKTAVSVTNSLPKIVIMLVLITFSLGISGLIIDIGRVVLQLALSLIPNILTLGMLGRLFINTIFVISVPAFMLLLGIGIATGGFALVPLAVAGLLIALILVLVLTFLCFYLVYVIMIRYAKFLLTTMFAPLVLLLLPLPGGSKYIIEFYRKQLAYILTIPIVVILVEIAFQVAASCIPSPFSGGVLGTPMSLIGGAASPCGTPAGGGSLNPFGFASAIAPFLGMGILLMAAKAPQIADEILSVKAGHGGGGGHGGMFGLLAIPAEGLENAGSAIKQYNYFKKPMQALATRGMLSAQGITNSSNLGAPTARISGQAGALLNNWTGKTSVPTVTELNAAGPEAKAKFDKKFLDVQNEFTDRFDPDTVKEHVERGDYLPLINNLRGKIDLPEINQSGQVANPRQASFGARAAGRAFGVNEETIRNLRAKSEEEHIGRSVIGGSLGGKPISTFGPSQSGTRGDTNETAEGIDSDLG